MEYIVEYWLKWSHVYSAPQLLFRVYDSAGSVVFKLPYGFLLEPCSVYIADCDDGLPCFAFHACTTAQLSEETAITDYLSLYSHEPLINQIRKSLY